MPDFCEDSSPSSGGMVSKRESAIMRLLPETCRALALDEPLDEVSTDFSMEHELWKPVSDQISLGNGSYMPCSRRC